MVAHLGVNPIRKINGGGTFSQTHHITFGRKHKNLLIEEVFFDRREVVVVVVVTTLLLPIHQLPKPVEPFRITAATGR